MYVLVTSVVHSMSGCDDRTVYKFSDDTDKETLDAYADEVAHDNADMYGAFDDLDEDEDEDDVYDSKWEILDGMPRSEIEELYGEIIEA